MISGKIGGDVDARSHGYFSKGILRQRFHFHCGPINAIHGSPQRVGYRGRALGAEMLQQSRGETRMFWVQQLQREQQHHAEFGSHFSINDKFQFVDDVGTCTTQRPGTDGKAGALSRDDC